MQVKIAAKHSVLVTSSKRWIQRLFPYTPLAAMSSIAVGAVTVLRHVDPNAPNNLLPPCLLYSFTGLYCPGCGSTRCLHALVHLDLPQAFSMNPLLVIGIVPVTLLALYAAGLLPKRFNRLIKVLAQPLPWLILLSSYMLLRNLPWYPFYLLAPS